MMRLPALLSEKTSLTRSHLWPRWLFLRALGLIFLSAFYSLAFQIHGLIGKRGILPVGDYLASVGAALHAPLEWWYAPTLLWINSSDASLTALVALGIVFSLLLTANLIPRASIAVCTLLFLSAVAALQDFSSYQSDGMLLEAGFVSLFFAPRGIRPGLGQNDPPSPFSRFMLQWEWFRIYLESGIVKLASGDPHWRNFTAMDDYYQNGPLPTWLGWYVQHLPHWYHAGTVLITLDTDLVLVWALFLPRPFRIACAAFVTALQVGIIATANYAFLNYLVLALGVLLLDDALFARAGLRIPAAQSPAPRRGRVRRNVETAVLGFACYATVIAFLGESSASVFAWPARVLAPFRIANAYGLFAVMTPARYEIEFQGSRDGTNWLAYEFRYKPQRVDERPGIYAPYQPRFEWNLWFASLGPWQDSPWVVSAQRRLLDGSPDVLRLFRNDPFNGKPPAFVRTVRWQYWFTTSAERRASGAWWRRELLGDYTGIASAP